ncbi:MAG: peptide deformylase [Bacteroidia bacterium]
MTRVLLTICLLGLLKGLSAQLPGNFTQQEAKMVLAAPSDAPMRVWLTTNYEDSLLLRSQCRPVTADPEDSVLQYFVKRLHATVTDSASLGVGIAAPQVGILRQIIWVQRFDKKGFPWEVMLNPRIIQYTKKKQPCREGCLSIPDKMDTTQTRAYAILLEHDRLDGTHVIEMVEDFTAVVVQHEVDHLNGIIFLDHLKEHAMKKADE